MRIALTLLAAILEVASRLICVTAFGLGIAAAIPFALVYIVFNWVKEQCEAVQETEFNGGCSDVDPDVD